MDEARGRAREERDRVGDLLRRSHSAHRVLAPHGFEELGRIALAFAPYAIGEVDGSGGYGVGANALAGQLRRQDGGVVDERRLDRVVGAHADQGFERRGAGDDHDRAGLGGLEVWQGRIHRTCRAQDVHLEAPAPPFAPAAPPSALTFGTRMSMPPIFAAASATQDFRASPSDTSTAAPHTEAPSRTSSAATASAPRAQNATRAPSATSVSTIARPIPRVPPVTTAFNLRGQGPWTALHSHHERCRPDPTPLRRFRLPFGAPAPDRADPRSPGEPRFRWAVGIVRGGVVAPNVVPGSRL